MCASHSSHEPRGFNATVWHGRIRNTSCSVNHGPSSSKCLICASCKLQAPAGPCEVSKVVLLAGAGLAGWRSPRRGVRQGRKWSSLPVLGGLQARMKLACHVSASAESAAEGQATARSQDFRKAESPRRRRPCATRETMRHTVPYASTALILYLVARSGCYHRVLRCKTISNFQCDVMRISS